MIGLALVAVVLVAMIKLPNFNGTSNPGFGLDWNCEQMPYGGSVCIKKPPPGLPNKGGPTD
jgi:hypothetical protein